MKEEAVEAHEGERSVQEEADSVEEDGDSVKEEAVEFHGSKSLPRGRG